MVKNIELNLEESKFGDFLFYEVNDKDQIDINDFKIIRSRVVDSILPMQIISNKEGTYIRYDLISELTITSYVNGMNSKAKLQWLISELARSLKAIEQGNLKLSNVILNKDKIYIDTITNELLLMYLPINNEVDIDRTASLKDMLKEIVLLNKYDENDDPRFFVRLFNMLVESNDVTVDMLQEFITNDNFELKHEVEKDIKEQVCSRLNYQSEIIKTEEDKIKQIEDSVENIQTKLEEEPSEDLQEKNVNVESGNKLSNDAKESEVQPINIEMSKIEIAEPIEVGNVEEKRIEINNVDDNTVEGHYSSKKVSNTSNNKIEIEEEINYKRVTRTEYDEDKKLNEKIAVSKPTEISIIPNVDNSICIRMDNYEVDKINDVIDNGMQTTALDESDSLSLKPYLIIEKINEKVIIDKDCFKLGRDKKNVDYAILSRAVGREHGLIIKRDNNYYFKDSNSKNGSFINGNRLEANNEYKISHKDKITLANEDMIFKLY